MTAPAAVPLASTMLPQIPNFYGGGQKDDETFQDWREHFEAVARLAGWDNHFKLVHLVAALKGQAKTFYRSCSPEKRSDYELANPVRITAIQTQLFHDRRQGAQETVDNFAQDLRKLYSEAYSAVACRTAEAETVGQTVVVSQFVAGLRPELQSKVVGIEGTMDQLVLKARFEEAKARELTSRSSFSQKKSSLGNQAQTNQPQANQTSRKAAGSKTTEAPKVIQPGLGGDTTGQARNGKDRKCYNCGLLKAQRKIDQTPTQWKEVVSKMFSPPQVTLNNYGGQQLDILAEIELTLTQGSHQVDSTVLMQKGAPNDLLLGTDLQPWLGFSLWVDGGNGTAMDLLSGERHGTGVERPTLGVGEVPTTSGDDLPHKYHTPVVVEGGRNDQVGPLDFTSETTPEVGEVRLLRPVKIPARFRKMVLGKVIGPADSTLIFVPEAGEGNVCMEDGVIEVGEEKCVVLVVEN